MSKVPGGHRNPKGKTHLTVAKGREILKRLKSLEKKVARVMKSLR